jgi:hypothetical protein
LKRKVIIHKHLFKNAGTTFDWSLKQNFGKDFCDHRDDEPMRKEGQPYLIRFLKEHPNIKALSSHHVWFRFEADNEIELIPVYWVRHPIERIRSVYNFEKQQKSNSLGARMAKTMNFKEYVAWRMQDDVPTTIRNFHTRHFAGVKTKTPLKEHHLNWAYNEIENCTYIGIVDLYDESIKIFEEEFKKIGIEIDLSYKVQNSFQAISEINVEERAQYILNDLGEIANEVLVKNQYDIEIYNYIKQTRFLKMTARSPILVTGIIRSGTTWVGRVLATGENTIYIHEPMNPQSSWNACFPTPVTHYHLNNKNGGNYIFLLKKLIELNPVFQGAWRNNIAEDRMKYISNNTNIENVNPQLIIKDPMAIYSVNWIKSVINGNVVFVLRHPISIIKSMLKLDWAKNLNFGAIKKQEMLMDYFYSDLNEKDNQIINSNWKNFSDVDKAVYSVRFFYLAICKYYNEKNEYTYISYENFLNNPYNNFLKLFEKLELKPSAKTINDLQSTTTYDAAKKHQNTSVPIKPDIDTIFNDEYGLIKTKDIFQKHFSDIYETLKNVVTWE